MRKDLHGPDDPPEAREDPLAPRGADLPHDPARPHDRRAHRASELVAGSETGARAPRGWTRHAITGLCLAWALFQLYIASQLPVRLAQWTEVSLFANIVPQARYLHLAFALALASLVFPLTRWSPRERIPVSDGILLLLGAGACLYLVVFRDAIADRPGLWTTADLGVAATGIVVLLISVYRALGLALVIVACVFLAFTLFGGEFAWVRNLTNFGGASLPKALGHYWMQMEGVFGVALGVSTRMIFLFVLFGALLERAGGGNWFIQVAIAVLGALRGGPAKASVLASGMTGIISGSSIANTVTTGTFTIPLMKRIGFSREKAGAVEVAASTNGQLTPPVMGAAAFLMVEYVGISYLEVLKHAFLPAVVSYLALLYIVHLESLKLGLRGLEKDGRRIGILLILLLFLSGFLAIGTIALGLVLLREALEPVLPGRTVYLTVGFLGVAYLGLLALAARFPDPRVDPIDEEDPRAPRLTPTFLGGAYFLLPIAVLIWNLMVDTDTMNRLSPGLSAFWATLAMMGVAVTHRPLKALFRRQGSLAPLRRGASELFQGLILGSRNMIAIGVATGAAGLIVGTISLTGAHQVIGQVIETLSGGNLLLLLLLVAGLSLLLGLGLPTTANYIVVSSLMAPVIVTVGASAGLVVPLIAVHLFVFYFGILADDTPPVGLAAYAAAAISRGDPIRTGVQGFAYDIRTAILPFLFLFNTDLLLIDVGPLQAVLVFAVALVAMFLFAAAVQGYFLAPCRWWERVFLLLLALMLFRPGLFMDPIAPPFEERRGEALLAAFEDLPPGEEIRLELEGPDFDTGQPRTLVYGVPATAGGPEASLRAEGLTAEGTPDGFLRLDEPAFGSPADRSLSTTFDFYAPEPVRILSGRVPADRPPKELTFLPALGLLAVLAFTQYRRAPVPPF